MGNKAHWLDYVKEAAVQAVYAGHPCDYLVGTVTSAEPLEIRLSDGDGIDLPAEFIHLARNVTDYEVTVTVSDDYGWKTEGRDGGEPIGHRHDIVIAKKKIKVHNALKTGEKVLMIRKSGGQDYIIVDRVVN